LEGKEAMNGGSNVLSVTLDTETYLAPLFVVTVVQDLATGGRSIATTIHQPSGRLYQKLDKLMLLAEGHMMYYGKAHEVGGMGGGKGFGKTR
jgi:ABC-type multidrug transport system ATPase subunit